MATLEKAGFMNTDEALRTLKEAVETLGVRQVVVASTRGDTGLAVAKMFEGQDVNVVVVTHNVGFREPGVVEMEASTRKTIESFGARVLTGTMALRNIGTAIREKSGFSLQDLIANTLRLFGQGTKVCVEIVLMAADTGLIEPSDVLAVAGTGKGADTVALIAPASSNKLFDLKVRDILIKPRDW